MADKRVALIKRANKLFRQGKAEAAVKEYKKILEIKPDDLEVRRIVGDLELRQSNNKGAIEQFEWIADYYLKEGFFSKAIAMYKRITLVDPNYESALFKLAELYIKKGFTKLDPGETEVILRVGKVCIQREDYDRAFNLLLPIINKNIKNEKYDEAANLLRFIIASNNSYLPALNKLAEIFKLSGKTNFLIAVYESLIPIYEKRGMKQELKRTLEELLQISDDPVSYEEQLAKLTAESAKEEEEAAEERKSKREKEFVSYNLRRVEIELKSNNVRKVIEILKKAKATFPKNVEIRKKLFEVYLEAKQPSMHYCSWN